MHISLVDILNQNPSKIQAKNGEKILSPDKFKEKEKEKEKEAEKYRSDITSINDVFEIDIDDINTDYYLSNKIKF